MVEKLPEEYIDIVENKFLNNNKNERVKIFLTNGNKLEAELIEFDDIGVVISQKGNSKKNILVYKHAIASIAEE